MSRGVSGASTLGFAVVVTSTTGYSAIYFTTTSSSDAAIEIVLAERKRSGVPFTGGSVLAFVVDNKMLDKARIYDSSADDAARPA